MKTYTLLDRNREPYQSPTKGLLGGHRKQRTYGRLDCENALRWIAKGHYIDQRVFFTDEATARAAGYRPCGFCMKREYGEWKVSQEQAPETPLAAYERAEALGLQLLEQEVYSRSELARNLGMLLLRIGTFESGVITQQPSEALASFEERRQALQDQIADVIEVQPDLDPLVGMRVLLEMALLYVEQIHDQVSTLG